MRPDATAPLPTDGAAVFETELLGIDGVAKPDKILYKEVADKVEEAAEEASEGVAEKVASVVADAAEAAKTMMADTDEGAESHAEL